MQEMTSRYVLNIWQPAGGVPDADTLAAIGARLDALNADIKAAGHWVFTGGLHSPDASTVVRPDGMVTDGPYVEGTEFIGGFWILDCPDLDAALEWGRRAAEAIGLPIEIRPSAG
jgi:hypothetical protein